MKNTLKKLSVIILIMATQLAASQINESSLMTPHQVTNTPELSVSKPDTATLKNELSAIATEILADQRLVTIGIQNCLINLATYISNGLISSLKNPAEALQNIALMIRVTNDIINNTQMSIDAAIQILHFNHAILLHIDGQISETFQSFALLDINTVLEKPVTPDNIQDWSKNNKSLLSTIDKRMETISLQWYSHYYRWINDTIVTPVTNYSLLSRFLGVSAVSTFLLYTWSRLDKKSFFASRYVPGFYKKILGISPLAGASVTGGSAALLAMQKNIKTEDQEAFNKIIEEEQNNEEINKKYGNGIVGRFENFFLQLSVMARGGGAAIYYGLQAYAAQYLVKEFVTLTPDIINWVKIKHNYLLGGSYITKANRLKKYDCETGVRFDNLIGMDHVKQQFRILIDYIQNPEPYALKGLTPHKGYLLYGASRAGKSHIVKALFNEIKEATNNTPFRYFEITAAAVHAFGISRIINDMKSIAPCVVFIDEIDLVGLGRDGANITLSDFLISMSDGIQDNDPAKQIIIIAATNRPETLDHALRREGRFGMQLFCRLPNINERATMFTTEFNKRCIDIRNFDIKQLAAETEGQSYQAIALLVGRGILKAALLQEAFCQKHIESVLNEDTREILTGIDTMMTKEQEELLATHFAGMALTLSCLGSDVQVSSVTTHAVKKPIKDTAAGLHLLRQEDEKKSRYHEYGKIFTYRTTDTIEVATYDAQIAQCTYLMAGVAAEEVMFGKASYTFGCSNTDEAFKIAYRLVSEGLHDKQKPDSLDKEFHDSARKLLTTCKENAKQIIGKHKDLLVELAHELTRKKLLSGSEVRAILKKADANTMTHTTETVIPTVENELPSVVTVSP